MKKIITFLLFSASLFAQNVMHVPNYGGRANDTLEIAVKITNANSFVAFQTDVALPAQVTYIPNSAVLTARSNGHSVSASLLQNNVLRIIAFSISQAAFTGDTGSVANFKIKLKTEPGVYPLELINSMISNATSQNILTSSSNGTVTIISPRINATPTSLDFGSTPLWNSTDRTVTIQNTGSSDLTVSRIYSGNSYFKITGDTAFVIPPENMRNVTIRFNSLKKGVYNTNLFIISNDPSNGTTTISMTGTSFAVNELHGGSSSGRSGYPVEVNFSMNNMEPIVGLQFDIVLPNVLTFIPDSIFLFSRKQDHIVSANYVSSNRLRVVAFSITNKKFTDSLGNIIRIGFNLDGTGGNHYYNIENVILSDTNAQNVVSAVHSNYVNIASPDIHGNGSIGFGEVSVRDTSVSNYEIYNWGNDTLKISSISSDNSSFWTNASLPIVIPQGNSRNISISFHNVLKGSYSGRITVRSNDPDEDPFYINLSGTSFNPEYIKVQNNSTRIYDTVTVKVDIENYESFVAFQFDMEVPDSLTYINNSAVLTSRKQDHILSVGQLTNKKFRVFSFSFNQLPFLGNFGAVIEMKFRVGKVSGAYPLTLTNGLISNARSQNIIKSAISGSLTIQSIPFAKIKVFLQGSFSIDTGAMSTMLYTKDLIPKNQPYNTEPWNYSGNESVATVPEQTVDWVLIEIRSDISTIIGKKAALLKSDGSIIDISGADAVPFESINGGNYYIVINHRNHLAVMSASVIALNENSPIHDFTDSQNKTYGTNAMKDLGSGKFGMYAGDANGDGKIKYNGASNDRGLIYGKIGGGSTITTWSGYSGQDLNLDGVVKYNGAGNDRGMIYNNLGGGSTIATISSQVPTATMQPANIIINPKKEIVK